MALLPVDLLHPLGARPKPTGVSALANSGTVAKMRIVDNFDAAQVTTVLPAVFPHATNFVAPVTLRVLLIAVGTLAFARLRHGLVRALARIPEALLLPSGLFAVLALMVDFVAVGAVVCVAFRTLHPRLLTFHKPHIGAFGASPVSM